MLARNEQCEIREIQKVQLEILLDFDRICKKHNIKYQLFAGTLLGAIRHNGFIPWDDDIDLCLTRDEYNKFIEISKQELNKEYFLQTYDTDRYYYKQLARIRKNNTLMLQDLYSGLDMHHGICISLMPLDNVVPGTLKGDFHRILYQLLLNIFSRINDTRSLDSCKKRTGFKKNAKILLHYIFKIIPKKKTDSFHTKIACMFNNKETQYITHLTNGATKKRYYAYMMKREEFYDVIEGDFEGYKFPIPRNYHYLLSNLYGDYMKLPPEEKQKPHHGVVKISFNNNLDDSEKNIDREEIK